VDLNDIAAKAAGSTLGAVLLTFFLDLIRSRPKQLLDQEKSLSVSEAKFRQDILKRLNDVEDDLMKVRKEHQDCEHRYGLLEEYVNILRDALRRAGVAVPEWPHK
jgi:hypothetical protein